MKTPQYYQANGERAAMMDSEVLSMTALEVSQAFEEGVISPLKVAELCLDKAVSQSSPIFLKITEERALREASASTNRWKNNSPLSKLDGVPIAWKDLIDMEGEITSAASILFRDAVPASRDAPLVKKASNAGMVSIGRLNMTELAFSGVGYNPHFGTPKNIYSENKHYIPGGSSSGSGVAVAGNYVPIAIGSDTGGSVRVPAALNGVVGYKSSEGRYETKGVIPLSRTFDTIGPLARSVSDCIEIDKIFRPTGYHNSIDKFEKPKFYYPNSVVLDGLDKEVENAFNRALDNLVDAGFFVAPLELECFKDTFSLIETSGTLVARDAWQLYSDKLSTDIRNEMDERVLDRILRGESMSASDIVELNWLRRNGITEIMQKTGSSFLLMPSVPITAPELQPLIDNKELFHKTNLKILRNTTLGNIFNLPGVTIPIQHLNTKPETKPVGLLISTYGGRDDELLKVSEQVERVLIMGEE